MVVVGFGVAVATTGAWADSTGVGVAAEGASSLCSSWMMSTDLRLALTPFFFASCWSSRRFSAV